MNRSAFRRWTIGLTLAVALLTVACAWLYVKHAWLAIQVAFAADQAEIFDAMRDKASAISNPAKTTQFLEYVGYYPSGTKQWEGSLLDQLVERHRASAVREIIAELRRETGKDLGYDPRAWIAEYADTSIVPN